MAREGEDQKTPEFQALAFENFLSIMRNSHGPIELLTGPPRKFLEEIVRDKFGEDKLALLPPPEPQPRGSSEPTNGTPASSSQNMNTGDPKSQPAPSEPGPASHAVPSTSTPPMRPQSGAQSGAMAFPFPQHHPRGHLQGHPQKFPHGQYPPSLAPQMQFPPAQLPHHPAHYQSPFPHQGLPKAARAAPNDMVAHSQILASGLRSPTISRARMEDPEFLAEYVPLSRLITGSKADVVRQVVRDNHAVCLSGTPYHTGYVLKMAFGDGSPQVFNETVRDHGDSMVRAAKQQFVRHMSAQDFDEVADQLLSKVSNNFLDKALARRFETISARALVNSLARAERLGYDVQDIVEEQINGNEHVIPSAQSLGIVTAPGQPPIPIPNPPDFSQILYPHLPHPPAVLRSSQAVAPRKGPYGIVYCSVCDWPCASHVALDYHLKKSACGKVLESDRLGKEICYFCGCRFGTAAGVHYHFKSDVCGKYSDDIKKALQSLIQEARRDAAAAAPAQSFATHSTPRPQASADLTTPLSDADPYSKLTPEQRSQFDREMNAAEQHYGNLRQEALALPEPEREKKLAALKNRFNTKQSGIRKRYGIRLRQRRSRAQIHAEKTRLYTSRVADGPSFSGSNGPATKRVKVGHHQSLSPASSRPSSSSQADTPHRRVPIAEMGGLSGSAATAELIDPTQAQRAQPTSGAPHPLSQSRPGSQTNSGVAQSGVAPTSGRSVPAAVAGTQNSPVPINIIGSDDGESDLDTDTDDDVPASLFAAQEA